MPLVSHVCALLPEHCFCPGVHDPLHIPPTQVPLPHATGLPYCPHAPHVSTPPDAHCACPGVHAGVVGHEHVPQAQLAVQVCVPYVLHPCVVVGTHAPWPEQLPLLCQLPVDVHVWVSIPQLPHGTGCVCPGAHMPTHAPARQVWSTHAWGAAHIPSPPQVCTPLPEQRICPGVQLPASTGEFESLFASPPLPLLLPLDPLLLPLVSVVASPDGCDSSDASGEPVSERSSMPAIDAHPTATGPMRPRTTAMRAPLRMSLSVR
jgi:hypothetical protein